MDNANDYVPEGRPFKYCNNCGAKIDKEAEICPKCGVKQAVNNPVPSRGNYGFTPPPTQSDTIALGKVKLASIFGTIGTLLPLVSIYAIYASYFGMITSLFSGSSSSPAQNTAFNLSSFIFDFELYAALILVGSILGIVSLVIYRSSFGELMEVDNKSFKSPYRLVKYFYIGLILLIIAYAFLFVGIIAVVKSTVTSTGAGAGSSFIGFALLGGLLGLIGGIMMLVGLIGLVLGLWAVGSRYDNTLIKVGAILYIIPYADIVAPILIFIGAHSTAGSLESGGSGQQSYSSRSNSVGSVQQDPATRLADLKKLLDSGQISQEDYDKKRKEILNEL